MDKRGQATLFIILGIVLVVIIVLLFTTKTIELPRRSVESSQVSNVDAYVESCVKEVVDEDVRERMKYGGYDRLTENTIIAYDGLKYNLLYDAKVPRNYFLTKENVENELNIKIKNYLKENCDLSRFGDVDYSPLRVGSFVNDYNLVVTVYLPITLTRGGSINKDTFVSTVDTNFGKFWSITYDIIEALANESPISYSLDDFQIDGPHASEGNIQLYNIIKRDDERPFRFVVRSNII